MADKEKRSILMSDDPDKKLKESFLSKSKVLIKKAGSFYPRRIRTRSLGIGGDIGPFERKGNKPPVFVDWKVAYMRGGGKAIKSSPEGGKSIKSVLTRETVRVKKAPRLRIRIRF